jgi:hypothetical protein
MEQLFNRRLNKISSQVSQRTKICRKNCTKSECGFSVQKTCDLGSKSNETNPKESMVYSWFSFCNRAETNCEPALELFKKARCLQIPIHLLGVF